MKQPWFSLTQNGDLTKHSCRRNADSIQDIVRKLKDTEGAVLRVHPSAVRAHRELIPSDLLGRIFVIGSELEVAGRGDPLAAYEFCEECGRPTKQPEGAPLLHPKSICSGKRDCKKFRKLMHNIYEEEMNG